MLSMKGKISLLSLTATTLVVSVLFISLYYTYTTHVYTELDRKIISDWNTVSYLLKFDSYGRLHPKQETELAATQRGILSQYYYLMRDKELRPLQRSAHVAKIDVPDPDIIKNPDGSYLSFNRLGVNYRTYSRIFNKEASAGRELYVLQLLQPMSMVEDKISELRNLMLIIIPIVALFTAIGAWWVAHSALQPIKILIKTVNNINARDLTTRLKNKNQDEIGQLSVAFNSLLERLKQTFDTLVRFTADASHELRTPLTSLRSRAEVSLSRIRTAQEYRETLGLMLEDVVRIEHLVTLLLALARGDAGLTKLKLESQDISALTTNWIEYYSPLADERKINIVSSIKPNIVGAIDRSLYESILTNLLQNAISFTPESGTIQVALTKAEHIMILQVFDSGPGIPDNEKQRVFERFVRLDHTRQLAPGSGLGLALVKAAVTLQGGNVQLIDNKPSGCGFVVRLPVVDENPA